MAVEPKVSLWALLEKRYEEDQGWLLFYEVANATGFKGRGYADALAMSVWPSRGISLLGFEVKHSRSDLITELRDENKANHFLRYCNRWWLVLSDAKFADGVEVPATWGIMAPRNNVLYQVRPAPELTPEPWKPEFIAALMRRFWEAHMKKDLKAQAIAVDERAKQLAKLNINRTDSTELAKLKRNADHFEREAKQLKDLIADFQTKSGLQVDGWTAGAIGEAVRQLLDRGNHVQLRRSLENAKDSADRISKSMNGALVNLDQLEKQNSK